jgi:uncharacterized protein
MRPALITLALSALQFHGLAASAAAPSRFVSQQATGQISAEDIARVRAQADSGDPAAQESLARMYLVGQGVEKDKQKAVEWFHKSARQGNADAMYDLGSAYYNGDGVSVNDTLSFAWFTLANEKGNPMAAEAVQRAESDLKPPIITDGYVQIAKMYEAGIDLPHHETECAKWALKAAQRGDSLAESVIGMKLMAGVGVTKDYAAALDWCRKSANQHEPGGEYCLGHLHEFGLGVARNMKVARSHYELAVARRYPLAIRALAHMEVNGEGGKRDLQQASLLYISLATAGDAEDSDAMFQLATLRHAMDPKEWKKVEARLPAMRIDPAKLNSALDKIKVP